VKYASVKYKFQITCKAEEEEWNSLKFEEIAKESASYIMFHHPIPFGLQYMK